MADPATFENFFPKRLKDRCRTKSVHLLKVGYVGLELGSSLSQALRTETGDLIGEFAAGLREVFEKSPNVMEIHPKRGTTSADEPFSPEYAAGFKGYRMAVDENLIELHQAFEIRVSLSEQQRYQFGLLYHPAPEQMWIHYDGGLFFAAAELFQTSEEGTVGQAARDFIRSVVADGSLWKPTEGPGPTPIQPEFFLVAVEMEPHDRKLLEDGIVVVPISSTQLMLIYPAGTSLNDLIERFRSDTAEAVSSFYNLRRICDSIDKQLEQLTEINERLSELLANFFNRGSWWALIKRITRKIRRQLSEGHARLQELSRLELLLRKQLKYTNSIIENTAFLKPFNEYFVKEASVHQEFDKETQLKFMQYAASETATFGVMHSTVWASIIGAMIAIIASLVTLLIAKSSG